MSSLEGLLLTSLTRKTVTGHSGEGLQREPLKGVVFLAGAEFESLRLSRKLAPVARRQEFWESERPGVQTSRQDPESVEPGFLSRVARRSWAGLQLQRPLAPGPLLESCLRGAFPYRSTRKA